MIDMIIRIIAAIIGMFHSDRREMDAQLVQARLSLEEAAQRVRGYVTPPSDGSNVTPPPPPRVNPHPLHVEVPNDGWLPEKIVHITNIGRAVKLPKKDER